MNRRATAAAFVTFTTLGVLYATLGPAIPEIREDFGVGAAVAGLVVSAQFAGAMTGIVASGVLERRFSTGLRLVTGLALMAGGTLGLVAAPVFWLVVAAMYVAGLGFGTVDLGFSTLFASGFGARSAAMTNLLHSCFGLGAVTGPFVISVLGDYGYRLPLAGAALAAAAVIPLARAAPDHREHVSGGWPSGRARLVVAAFALLYLLETGTEASLGGWAATHLQALGASESRAAAITALFFAALTAGRLATAPLTLRVGVERVIVAALSLLLVAVLVTAVDDLAPAAYVAAGLGCAPFFPTAFVWLVASTPGVRGAPAMVVAASNVGGVLLPVLVGLMIEGAGADAIPAVLTASSAAVLLTALAMVARMRPHTSVASTA